MRVERGEGKDEWERRKTRDQRRRDKKCEWIKGWGMMNGKRRKRRNKTREERKKINEARRKTQKEKITPLNARGNAVTVTGIKCIVLSGFSKCALLHVSCVMRGDVVWLQLSQRGTGKEGRRRKRRRGNGGRQDKQMTHICVYKATTFLLQDSWNFPGDVGSKSLKKRADVMGLSIL